MFYVPTASRPPLGVVLFIASAHVFNYKKLVKKPSRKKPRKNPGQKKAGPEAPANLYQKPPQNSKQQRGRLKAPTPKNGVALKRRPIFGVVVMNFELVF